MGDRANVVIRDGNGADVWLYTHWAGSELPGIVRAALKRGEERWTDAPYLARIVFCEMIRRDVDGLTGYGISADMCDNEHDIMVLDVDAARVKVYPADYGSGECKGPGVEGFTFAEFAAGALTREERDEKGDK